MINIILAGVGGQGTVLASKILANAAQSKKWKVRTAETIGMSQRGGSVVSHVRMGNCGEDIHSPLISEGEADVIIAFEPGEGARAMSFLKPQGKFISATTAIPSIASELSNRPYGGKDIIQSLLGFFKDHRDQLYIVPDAAILRNVGNGKALNVVLLASVIFVGALPLTLDDLNSSIEECVKPAFVDINKKAIEETVEMIKGLS